MIAYKYKHKILKNMKGGDNIIYEFINYIYEATKDWQETYSIFNAFIEHLECYHSEDIIRQIKNELEEISNKNDICQICGGDLIHIQGKQSYVSEAWGKPIYEREVIKKCSNCGWKED